MQRHRVGREASRADFTRNAMKTSGKNLPRRRPMRGGYRL